MRVWVLKPDGEATHIWKCIHHQYHHRHHHHRHHHQVGRQHIYGKTGLWPAAGSCQISTYGDCHLMCHRISVKNMKVSVIWSKYDLTNCCPLWWRKVLTYQCLSPERGVTLRSQRLNRGFVWPHDRIGVAEWYTWYAWWHDQYILNVWLRRMIHMMIYYRCIYVLACQMKLFKYLNWQGAHTSSFCALPLLHLQLVAVGLSTTFGFKYIFQTFQMQNDHLHFTFHNQT